MAGFNITVAGDSAINLEFGNVISEKTNGLIRAAAQTLEADPINVLLAHGGLQPVRRRVR